MWYTFPGPDEKVGGGTHPHHPPEGEKAQKRKKIVMYFPVTQVLTLPQSRFSGISFSSTSFQVRTFPSR